MSLTNKNFLSYRLRRTPCPVDIVYEGVCITETEWNRLGILDLDANTKLRRSTSFQGGNSADSATSRGGTCLRCYGGIRGEVGKGRDRRGANPRERLDRYHHDLEEGDWMESSALRFAR